MVLGGYGNYNTYAVQLNVSGTTVTAGRLVGALSGIYLLSFRLPIPSAADFRVVLSGHFRQRHQQRADKTINNANPPTHYVPAGCQHWIGERCCQPPKSCVLAGLA